MSRGLASKSSDDTSQFCASGRLQLSNVSVPSEVPPSSNLGSCGRTSKREIIQYVRRCVFIIHHILTHGKWVWEMQYIFSDEFYHFLHVSLVFFPYSLPSFKIFLLSTCQVFSSFFFFFNFSTWCLSVPLAYQGHPQLHSHSWSWCLKIFYYLIAIKMYKIKGPYFYQIQIWWYLSTNKHVDFCDQNLCLKIWLKGLPWWRSGWESACQCRGHGFEPWSGKIPHAAEQLGPWACVSGACALQQERPR